MPENSATAVGHAARTSCLLAALVLGLGCKTSLSARKDAGPAADARAQDDVADVASLPDLPGPDEAQPDRPFQGDLAPDLVAKDLVASDLGTAGGTPRAFRFDNHTDRTAYVDVDSSIGCRRQSSSGWETCSYFRGCMARCASVPQGKPCCAYCDEALALYVVQPGASLSLPWDGQLRSKVTGYCSEGCLCEQETAVSSGDFEASACIYAGYTCMPSGCGMTPDGRLELASPVGDCASVAVQWHQPYPGEEVVIDITWLPPSADAGATPDVLARDAVPGDALLVPDSILADGTAPRDASSDPIPVPLADLAGRTYRISASTSLPDASAGGRSCATSNPGAVYDLTFSSDGAKVSIVRVDGPEEVILSGSLSQASSAPGLVYDLDNAFAGGHLAIRVDGSALVALLVLYGSGVPVLWCIDSPMTPASSSLRF